MKAESTYQRIYRVVATIPKGKVATYGQIAELAGYPRAARQVGYALAALHDDWKGVPWHRVINAQGGISLRGEAGFEGLQQAMLRKEGVRFDAQGRVDLRRYRWDGSSKPVPRGKGAGASDERARARTRTRSGTATTAKKGTKTGTKGKKRAGGRRA